jgi:FMN phosphatase YigB (HAD superfamily)
MDKCKLVIFDLDNTLHYFGQEDISCHIRDIIKYFRRAGIRMAVASLNIFAMEYLRKYKILHLFECIEFRKAMHKHIDKHSMFKRIRSKTRIAFKNIIVFDDNFFHCMEAKSLGMKYIFVTKGLLSWDDVKHGMCLFNLKRARSCHL